MAKKKKSKSSGFSAADYSRFVNNGSNFSVDTETSVETRKRPLRVQAKRVQDKENPNAWYTKYTLITPAKNTNRPMEPIFNTAFSENGTNGVPKFVDLDVEWTGYADTFMMNQVIYNATQSLRLALKSNLVETQDEIKACIVNGIALATAGKQLERDVHWNLYDAGDDFNFIKMYRLRNTALGGFGIVPLYPIDYLKDENLPMTNSLYDKIVSMYNNVLRLPTKIGEFISHYFGSLFTLDKDGHNDQYLRLIMHNMDWYADREGTVLTTLDISNLDLDTYISLLDEYSKRYAIVLSDLRKCLSVNRIGLQKYNSYAYAFVFDRTIHQALINGYTSASQVSNGFIRMDQLDQISDELTQYLFMGAIQPDDNSRSKVKAIKVLDMVLKVNSDSNIKWPSSLDQLPLAVESEDRHIIMEEPFGLSIITDVVSDNTFQVRVNDDDEERAFIANPEPNKSPNILTPNNVRFYIGKSKGFFPSQNGYLMKLSKVQYSQVSELNAIGLVYLGCIATKRSNGNWQGWFYFAIAESDVTDLSITSPRVAFTKIWYCGTSEDDNADFIYDIDRDIREKSDPSFFFDLYNTKNTSIDAIMLLRIITIFNAHGVTNSSHNISGNPILPNVDSMGITFRSDIWGVRAYLSIPQDGEAVFGTNASYDAIKICCAPNATPAPVGLMSYRSIEYNAKAATTVITYNAIGGLDALTMFVSQVVDYHLPIAYKRRDRIQVKLGSTAIESSESKSLPVLVKEDYIPYYYNVLDLIPVLYEMFVSLFSIDALDRMSGKGKNPSQKDK